MQLRHRHTRRDVLVDITPLIDVVFLMLIFFMVSTSFTVASALKLELPSSESQAKSDEIERIVISVTESGQFYVQDEAVSEKDLRKRILFFSKGDSNKPVVLRADANARHHQVVLVLDTLRGLGMGKLAIATQREEN